LADGTRTSDYDFELPPGRIAQYPSERRELSRLLVLDRASGSVRHRLFADIVELIRPEDVLVVNETRVFPARLRGRREGGGAAEILLLHPAAGIEGVWMALARPGSRLKAGRRVEISEELTVEIIDETEGGERLVRLVSDLPVAEAIDRFGQLPLPPYLRRDPTREDRERYQTVYARTSGSVAAPTAGLHFTPELLDALVAAGVGVARLVLHVGVGTFRPVEVDLPGDHRMHREWFEVPAAAADEINRRRAAGGAIWAVGTTSVRTLESVASADGRIEAGTGWTDIFIRPPHRFRAVDRMITNFHLPRSTLLMLVAAFAGFDVTMEAYRRAIDDGYRFYSYGDAMTIL